MAELMTPSNITFALGILGVIFTVYNSFRKPQIEADKTDSLLNMAVKQLQLDLVNLRDNHVHTLDEKVSDVKDEVGEIKINVAKLWTILDERLPRKMV